jgi:predicted RNA-binding protein with EMAP domain
MDTAKDARILVLEDALRRLNQIIQQRRLKLQISYNELTKKLSLMEKLFYEVKYSYIESHALADLDATKRILALGKEFRGTYELAIKSTGYTPKSITEKINHAEVEYSLRIIEGFVNKLRTFDNNPGHAVDILAVEITQMKHVEGSKNLTECRCTDGSRIWKIVTNIEGINVGTKLPCAVLPPAEMMGVVSQAMFLGKNPLPDSIQLGIFSSPSSSIIDQARAQVTELIKRLK